MPSTIDLEAAALQRLSRQDMLAALLEAKRESDRRNYAAKTAILRKLLHSNSDEFLLDSEKDGMVGLTHQPLSFKIHMPRTALPDGITLKQAQEQPGVKEREQLWEQLEDIYARTAQTVYGLRKLAQKLPVTSELWLDADGPRLWSRHADDLPLLEQVAPTLTGGEQPPDLGQASWLRVKSAYSPLLRGITDYAALTEGPANAWYGGPRPIASMLVGGLTGAGLGYLGGRVAEVLGHGRLQGGRLRRTLALLGGLAGASPGALWGLYNVHKHGPRGLFLNTPGPVGPDDPPAEPLRNVPGALPPIGVQDPPPLEKTNCCLRQLLPDCPVNELFVKAAYAGGGFNDGPSLPPIDVDAFSRVIWSQNDPYSSPNLRLATTGLLDSSARMAPGSDALVGVGDIARMAVGMGSGYMAGRLVGRTLGALAGLDDEAQKTLQQAGTWSGVLKTVIPMAFGAR